MQKYKNNLLVVVSLIAIFCFSIVFADNDDKVTGEEHRNTVRTFVQEISDIADKEEKQETARQIKAVAKDQDDDKDDVADLIDDTKNKDSSWIKTFFIGTDYKNIGQLRSEMVQTRSQIRQLNNLLEKVTTDEDKKDLQDQIKTLEDEQQKINNFVNTNENKFSLFGWLVKLFNRQSLDTVKIATGATSQYLTDIKGVTLYYFTKDTSESKTNSCTGACASNWPIFYTEEINVSSPLVQSDFATITNDSGAKQITYRGWPLYYYYQDVKAGDILGDGIGGAWYLVKP